MQVNLKPVLKPAAPIFEQRYLSQAAPMGMTVKASINTLTSGKVAGKNQYAVSMWTEWTSLHQHQPHVQ
jgi:hypothetical protein